MPPLLTLILFGVWALAVVRLVCFRSTLSTRTLLTYLALGATMGPVAVSIAEKFFNEYSWNGGPTYFILINAGKQLLLLLPVVLVMGRPAWRFSSSITDAFLAAFCIGLGYDLIGSLIASAPVQAITGFSFLPPSMYSTTDVTVAGYGWWIGTTALVVALIRRTSNNAWLSYLVGAIVLLMCAFDQTLMTSSIAIPPTWWSAKTLHEVIVPYAYIVFLIAAVVFELSWTKSKASPGSMFSELQAVLPHWIGLRWEEARHAGAQFRVGRQLDIARTCMLRDPNDPAIAAVLSQVNNQFQLAQQPAAATSPINLKQVVRERAPHLGFILLAFILVLLFSLPSMQPFGGNVWQWFLFTDKWAPFQLNIVATLLLGWLAWCYATAPPAAYRGVRVDEIAQFDGERAILNTILAVFLIFTIYEIPIPPPSYPFTLPAPVEFVSFASPLSIAARLVSGANAPSDPNQGLHWTTVLLLLLCAATVMTARRAELWRAAPQPARLQTAVRHVLTALRVGIAAWLSVVLFTYIQIFAHQKFGGSTAMYFTRHNLSPQNGNSLLGLISAIVTVPGILGFLWVSQWITRRLQQFLFAVLSVQTTQAASGAAGKS